MKSDKFITLAQLFMKKSESTLKEVFQKLGNKVDEYKSLEEMEQELLKFGLDSFEYFNEQGIVPAELKQSFDNLKGKIDKLEE